MSRRTALVAALTLAGCDGGGGLPDGVAPFDGIDVSLASGDLEPLWPLLGDARLIGLGESIHTSGGFYAAKHRLIRVLIEERGVRVVAFESPRGRARALDGYLTSGNCDRPAREVFGISIFEVFVDDNTAALMRWICERNAALPGDPVRLFGFDIQQPDEDSAEIQTFLEAHAPGDAPALLAEIATCAVIYSDTWPTEAEHGSCVRGLTALDAWFAAHRAELVASAGERTTKLFELAAVSFRAAQEHYFLGGVERGSGYGARDLGMGAVFQRVLELDFPADARVAIWAHNIHLTRRHDRIATSFYRPGFTSFGTVLARVYGDAYAPVAITAFAPGTNWPQINLVVPHTEFGTSRGSVEGRLRALREPHLIVDPRAAFLEPDREQSLSEELMIPAEQYAAIVYLAKSPGMDAVFW